MIGWFMGLKLAGKIGVGIGAIVLLLGAIAGVIFAVSAHDKAIRTAAYSAGQQEVQGKWDIEKNARQKALLDFQTALGNQMGPLFDGLASKIDGIDTGAAKISVELPRAIAAEPRYIDPKCDLTAPVLEQVNAARALSRNPK